MEKLSDSCRADVVDGYIDWKEKFSVTDKVDVVEEDIVDWDWKGFVGFTLWLYSSSLLMLMI